jgi:hypothetical protein
MSELGDERISMESRGCERHRWANREVEWSFWEKRHRRQSRKGSGEEAGTRPSFKWAGAHELKLGNQRVSKFRSSKFRCHSGNPSTALHLSS